jgi:hypothetical protein
MAKEKWLSFVCAFLGFTTVLFGGAFAFIIFEHPFLLTTTVFPPDDLVGYVARLEELITAQDKLIDSDQRVMAKDQELIDSQSAMIAKSQELQKGYERLLRKMGNLTRSCAQNNPAWVEKLDASGKDNVVFIIEEYSDK